MKRLLAAIPMVLAASCAMMAPEPAPARPDVLTDARGMTLYTFDRDVAGSGKSMCNGPCAAAWPPQVAARDATPFGQYSVVTRDDGTKQWAYKGKPLYTWSKDARPGDRTGHNFDNAWRQATP